MMYVVSYKYVGETEEHKEIKYTVTQVLQQIDHLLRGSRAVDYIRISTRALGPTIA